MAKKKSSPAEPVLKTQQTGKTILSTRTLPNEWDSLGEARKKVGAALAVRKADRAEAKAEKEKKAALKSKLKKAVRIRKTFFRNKNRLIRKYS